MPYTQDLDAINAGLVAAGEEGAHTQTLAALNALAVELGGSGGHTQRIAALNDIAVAMGGVGGHTQDIAALNEIATMQDAGGPFAVTVQAYEALVDEWVGDSLTPVSTFIVAGQSNATVWLNEDLPADWESDPDIKIWNNTAGAWQTYDPGVNSDPELADPYWGPELELARAYRAANPSQPCYIFKYTIGGSLLYNDAGWEYGTWAPEAVGDIYDAALTAWNAAKAALTVLGLRTSGRVVLWAQGESDAESSSTYANAYQANLTAFAAAIRTDWGAGKIIVPRVVNSEVYTQRATVRAAQAAFVTADGNAVLTDSDRYVLIDGRYHINGDGAVQMGADAYEAHLGTYTMPVVGDVASFDKGAVVVGGYLSSDGANGNGLTAIGNGSYACIPLTKTFVDQSGYRGARFTIQDDITGGSGYDMAICLFRSKTDVPDAEKSAAFSIFPNGEVYNHTSLATTTSSWGAVGDYIDIKFNSATRQAYVAVNGAAFVGPYVVPSTGLTAPVFGVYWEGPGQSLNGPGVKVDTTGYGYTGFTA